MVDRRDYEGFFRVVLQDGMELAVYMGMHAAVCSGPERFVKELGELFRAVDQVNEMLRKDREEEDEVSSSGSSSSTEAQA